MNKVKKKQEWDLQIDAQSSLWDLNLKDVWRYRDLMVMFVKRDFVSVYKQTVLGPLWIFIQPLLTTIMFTFIFGNLAGISTDGLPRPLFYLAGITAWSYFADCLVKTSSVFRDNASIFGKVYFPRLITPLSIVVSSLLRFTVQMMLFMGMIMYYLLQGVSFQFTWIILVLPFIIFLMAILGLGLGLVITALTTRYRDLAFLVAFGVQLLMYSTTVIYPLSAAPEKYKFWIQLNPMTAIIESFRLGFLGRGEVTLNSMVYSTCFSLIALVIGILVFNKTEKTFVDTV